MNDLWFDPNRWAWLPGTAFGVLGGVWGSLVGTLAPMGKGKGVMVGFGYALVTVAALFLVAAGVAMAAGQPFTVWFFLGLPGLIGLSVVGPLLPTVYRRYDEAEGRKIQATDLQF